MISMKFLLLLLIHVYSTVVVGYTGDGISVGFGNGVGIGATIGNFDGIGTGLGGRITSTGSTTRNSPIVASNIMTLGLCADFVLIVGKRLVSLGDDPSEALTGNVGFLKNATLVGEFLLLDGTIQNNTVDVIQCNSQITSAFQKTSNATCTASNTFNNSDLAGRTLLPGVYCSLSGTFILSEGIVTFDGQNVAGAQWIFHTVSYVETFRGTHFKLINGAIATNIYWNIGTYITLGANSNFVGNIFTESNLSLAKSVSYVGRAFAEEVFSFGGSVLAMPVNPLTNAPTKAPVSKPPSRANPTPVPVIIGVVSGAVIFVVMVISLFYILGLHKKEFFMGPLSPREKIRYNDRVLSTYETNKKRLMSDRMIDSESKTETKLEMGPFSVGLNPASEPPPLTIYNPENQEVTEIVFEN